MVIIMLLALLTFLFALVVIPYAIVSALLHVFGVGKSPSTATSNHLEYAEALAEIEQIQQRIRDRQPKRLPLP